MLRAAEYTERACVVSMALLLTASVPGAGDRSATDARPALAYVRTVLLSPVAIEVPAAAQGLKEDGRHRRSDAGEVLRQGVALLASQLLAQRLVASGTFVSPASRVHRGPQGAVFVGPEALAEKLLAEARKVGADAVLLVRVDRFGVHDRLYREMWIRLRAHVIRTTDGRWSTPCYGLGVARTAPRLVARGYMRSDDELLKEAAEGAVGELFTALHTGRQRPLAREERVIVLPALVPGAVDAPTGSAGAARRIPVPFLTRQADVLLQPEVGPLAEVVELSAVRALLRRCSIDPAMLWRGREPNIPVITTLGRQVGADMAIISTIERAHVGEPPGGSFADGREARVTVRCVMVSVSGGTVEWATVQTGTASTVLRRNGCVEYVRSDAQAIVDAAIAAYGRVRTALEEYARGRRME